MWYCNIVEFQCIRIFFITFFLACSHFAFADGLTAKQLNVYFKAFLTDFPTLKFSGFFHNIDNKATGIHISNCIDRFCELSYNDYNGFKQNFTPLPECKSEGKLEIIDSTHAKIGNAVLKIQDNTLHIYGDIIFECEPHKITNNLQDLRVKSEYNTTPFYELVLKNAILEADANYPINLDCLHRLSFSESQICARTLLSNTYSFGQFFIFLAAQQPDAFHQATKVYDDYKIMQNSISSCKAQKRPQECIYTAVGKFEREIQENIILDNTPQDTGQYILLQ